MIDLQYHTPNTLEEVFDLLTKYGEDARVMGGGTALVIQMKQRLLQPEHVISLRKIVGLAEIKKSDEGIHVGALCVQRAPTWIPSSDFFISARPTILRKLITCSGCSSLCFI
jgi:CO/xanthine dehydrogenase FAD-binding subunit